MMIIRHWFIKTLIPFFWTRSNSRKVTALKEISLTELDSAWQSLYAMNFTDNPSIKAKLFQHAIEEMHHAEMFNHLSSKYSEHYFDMPIFTREILIDKNNDQAFLNFCISMYVGERDVNEDFVVYSNLKIDEDIQAVFKKIKADEEFHEEASQKIIERIANRPIENMKMQIFIHTIKRNYKLYSKFITKIGEIPLKLILTLLYLLIGPILNLKLKKRLYLNADEQLNILKDQKLRINNL